METTDKANRRTDSYKTDDKVVAESEQAITRTALIFHTSGFCTSFIIAAIWKTDGSHTLVAALENLMKSWRICLVILTLWMGTLSLSAGSSIRVGPLLLGSIGVIFTISNWIPYALIMYETSYLREQCSAYGQGHDDTATILAIHNMAMCVPQMVAAGAVAFLFAVLDYCDVAENRISWIFLLAMPAAAWGAWASETKDVYLREEHAAKEHGDECL
jgi:hypothetical protein